MILTLESPIKKCYNTIIKSRKDRETALRLLCCPVGGTGITTYRTKSLLCLRCRADFLYSRGDLSEILPLKHTTILEC